MIVFKLNISAGEYSECPNRVLSTRASARSTKSAPLCVSRRAFGPAAEAAAVSAGMRRRQLDLRAYGRREERGHRRDVPRRRVPQPSASDVRGKVADRPQPSK
jgi:hypothetical protein